MTVLFTQAWQQPPLPLHVYDLFYLEANYVI